MRSIYKHLKKLKNLLIAMSKRLDPSLLVNTVGILYVTVYVLSGPSSTLVQYGTSDERFVVRGQYVEAAFAAPNSTDEYGQTFLERGRSDGCGQKFALLIHEPHADLKQELDLFQLLRNLRSDEPDLFSRMTLFLEGTYAPSEINEEIPAARSLASRSPRQTMYAQSEGYWQRGPFYPLQYSSISESELRLTEELKDFSRGRSLTQAIPSWGLPDDARSNFLAHARFNTFQSRSDGSIETQDAFLDRLRSLGWDAADQAASEWEKIGSEDFRFSRRTIERLGLPAPYAFELYVEGVAETSADRNSVRIYGLEDPGLYGASCYLTGCMHDAVPASLSTEHTEILVETWRGIQPYRDLTMAWNIKETMREEYPQGQIPIVLASAPAHLPLVREELCKAGYDSATFVHKDWQTALFLPITKLFASGADPAGQYSTTPIPGWFRDAFLAGSFGLPLP